MEGLLSPGPTPSSFLRAEYLDKIKYANCVLGLRGLSSFPWSTSSPTAAASWDSVWASALSAPRRGSSFSLRSSGRMELRISQPCYYPTHIFLFVLLKKIRFTSLWSYMIFSSPNVTKDVKSYLFSITPLSLIARGIFFNPLSCFDLQFRFFLTVLTF